LGVDGSVHQADQNGCFVVTGQFLAQQALADWVQKNASPELLNALQNKLNDEPPTSDTSSSGKGRGEKKGGEE
jgi:hypothetical protein